MGSGPIVYSDDSRSLILVISVHLISNIINRQTWNQTNEYPYVETFKSSELGRIKSLLPLREMAISFGLIEGKNKSLRVKRGRKPFFSRKVRLHWCF